MFSLCLVTLCLITWVVADEDQYPYLPKSVIPIRYHLTLEAHPDKDVSFSGSVAIDVKVLESTRNITLHSKNLTIQHDSVLLSDATIHSVQIDAEKELYILHLARELVPGERHQLVIKHFVGSLEHEKYGFFLAKYHTTKGDERKIALTYFEPTGARIAFPCFDEPALKAKFVVSLIRSNSFHTAANAELQRSIILDGGRVLDVYKETVPMSTYLVAFAVVDFSYTRRNQRMRVLARKDVIRSANYVLSESVRLLKAMEEYTGVNYALDKVDLLAVPSHYFVDGAMENWGLITYSEDHLLYSKTESSTEDLQRCTTYTAHELAHQWFGNLVTPSKWNYLWLSEGFAAYFQFHLADIVEPAWRLKEQFVVDELQTSLSSDLEPMAQPINYVFPSPDEFPSAWIYYYKASSVIRMIEHFLTPAVFRRGLKMYLEKKKFSSSTPEDLYESLQKSVQLAGAQHLLGTLTVPEICSTWDTNVGYPLVTVSRNYTSGTITLAQETYNSNEGVTDSTWIIPISYATNAHQESDFSRTTADLWLTQKTITFNHFNGVNWIILNKQHAGYFRVNYDATNWNRLIKFLRTSKFRTMHVLNRAQLINDAFQLMEDGKLSAAVAMDLSVYVKHETDFVALKPFVKRVDSLDFMVSITDQYNTFKSYVKHVLNLAFGKVGLEENLGDSHLDKLQRVLLAKKMCLYGDGRCQSFGLRQLRLWKQTGALSVWSEIEVDVLCGGVQVAREHEWNFLLRQYYASTDKRKRARYITALGCSQDARIMTRFLDVVYDFQNAIEMPDRIEALLSVIESRITPIEFVLNYLVGKSIVRNSSFESAVAESRIQQIVPAKLIVKVNVLKDSGKDKYIPAKFFTEEKLETHENKYIAELARWLLENNNFV